MIASSKTLDSLKTIGLNKYERNIWSALLSKSSASAGELSEISNVPRSRCYDVLESLAEKGFIVIQPGKPMKYIAINPKEALERVKKRNFEKIEEVNKKINRLMKTDTIKELERLYKNNFQANKPEHLTGALRGRDAIMRQIESMIKNAKKSVKIMTTEKNIEELIEKHEYLMKKIAKNGVKIQIALPVQKQKNPYIENIKKYAEIKNLLSAEHINKMIGRIVIIDGKEFLIGLTDETTTHPTQDIALWTQSFHTASNVFEPMFNMIWKHAEKV